MSTLDPDALLAMLRDPNRETQELATASGAPREAAARAARMVHGIARAKAEDLKELPAALALAVLRAAAAAGRADLLASAVNHPSKEVAKDGKRALYLLRSRGVEVPEARRAAPPAPASPAEPPLPCFASVVDGSGERALWIARAVPGKGIEVAQAILSDIRGLRQLQLGMLGRKEYRQFSKDILARGRALGVGEIPAAEAKGLAAEARKLNDAAGAEVPAGADGWLARIGPGTPPADPAELFPPLPAEEERRALAESGGLTNLPLLRGWLPDEEELRRLAAKLDEIAASTLFLDERQRAEAARGAIAQSAAGWLDPTRRRLVAARLHEVAGHLVRAGDPAHAHRAAACARALLADASPSQIPFVIGLFDKAFPDLGFAHGSAESAPAEGGDSPLIVPGIR